jgi:hypothetical protein
MADNANTANIKANTAKILARSAEASRNSAAANRQNTATGAGETGEGVIGAAIGGVAVTGATAADSSLSAEVIRTTGIGTHIGAGAILTRTTAIILRIGTLTTVAPYQDNDSMGPDPCVISRRLKADAPPLQFRLPESRPGGQSQNYQSRLELGLRLSR